MIIESLKYSGMCSCGKEHKMETAFCIVESGCLKDIKKHISKYSLTGFTTSVYDENTYDATSDRHPDADCEIILPSNKLHANEHGVELLLEQLPPQTEVLIAVGSGTIHDIVRYCAYKKGVDFVSCPTAASVDGFCSSVAAMIWHGCKKTLTAVAPKIVIADIDIIKNAPLRLTKSGFGDMIGKYIALTDWKISNIVTGEYYCNKIANMTLEATKVTESSVEDIFKRDEKAFEKLMYGLLLSGIAMQMIGNSRPASGAEHHISHMIEMEPIGINISSDALHGEKVGVGTLLTIKEYLRIAELTDVSLEDYKEFDKKIIIDVFGSEKADEILKENDFDCAKHITAYMLESNWKRICEEINKLPDIEKLRNIYIKFGIKSKLSDIGVNDNMVKGLYENSPMVRNRLTFMRLRSMIKNVK